MASSAVGTGCGCEARKKEKFQTVCHWLRWFKPSGVKTPKGKRFTLSCLKARSTNLLSLASRRCECMRRLPEARLSRGRNHDCHIRCGRALQLFSIDSRDMIRICVAGFDTSVGIVCRRVPGPDDVAGPTGPRAAAVPVQQRGPGGRGGTRGDRRPATGAFAGPRPVGRPDPRHGFFRTQSEAAPARQRKDMQRMDGRTIGGSHVSCNEPKYTSSLYRPAGRNVTRTRRCKARCLTT